MFRIIVALASVVTVLALVSVAAADSPHFKRGSPAAVVDNGLTFSQKASVSGLGNGDLVVTLTITNVQPTAVCQNPSGKGQEPAGQNPAPSDISGSVAVPGSDIKNGTLTITVSTAAPTTPIPGAPDCSNPGWTEVIKDMSLTSASVATLTFYADLNSNGVVDSGEPVILSNP